MTDQTVVAPNGTTSTRQADGSYSLAAPTAKPVDNTVVPNAPVIVTSGQSRAQYGQNVQTLQQATGQGMPSATSPGQSTAAQNGARTGAAPQQQPPEQPDSTKVPAGWDATTYANFKQANPTLEPNAQDTAAMQAASATKSGFDLIDPQAKALLQSNITDLQSQADQAKAQVDAATATLNNDPAMAAAAQYIKNQYDQLIKAMVDKNKVVVGRAQTGVSAFGGLGQMSQNFMSDEMDKATQRVSDLQAQEADLINKSNEAYKSGDVKALNDAMANYNKINSDKMTAVNSLLKAATDATAQARQEKIDAQNEAHQNLQDMISGANLILAQNKEAFSEQSDTAKQQLDIASFNYKQQQDVIDNAFKQGQITETQRHNLATEALSRAALGPAPGTGAGETVPSVQMGASGTPDPSAQAAFLDALPGGVGGDLATMVKGIANYTMNPADFSTRSLKSGGTITRAQIITLAQKYDPSYSDQNYSVRQTYLKSLAPGGKTYDAIVSANKAISHLTSYADTVSSIGNGGAGAGINALGTALVSPFSPALQTKAKQAQTEAAGVKDELAKFFKGVGSTDVGSLETWSKQLDTNATPGQLRGTVQGAITLLSGQLDVLTQKYVDTMGKEPAAPLLQPATIQKLSNLKNQGYQVDVPGVYYSDPQAYMKNGGTTEKLDAARAALKQANDPNNPPTPENVLQLAQIMQ